MPTVLIILFLEIKIVNYIYYDVKKKLTHNMETSILFSEGSQGF
jgi:hypothetical protein